MSVREAETLQVEHAQGVHHSFRAGGGFEMIAGEF